jgi:hypothetical protein
MVAELLVARSLFMVGATGGSSVLGTVRPLRRTVGIAEGDCREVEREKSEDAEGYVVSRSPTHDPLLLPIPSKLREQREATKRSGQLGRNWNQRKSVAMNSKRDVNIKRLWQ